MIVVKVELHSAITHEITEIARMHISNVGGTRTRGDYGVQTFRGRKTEDFRARKVQRDGRVENYPRLSLHIWNLVARALRNLRYE